MINVTRFDHTALTLNADLIEYIESCPDTHITLVTGRKLLVCESATQIVDLVIEYRRRVGRTIQLPQAVLQRDEMDED